MARSSKTPLPGAMDEALEIFVGDPSSANVGGGGQDDKEKEKTYTFSHLSFHDALYEQRCWRDLNGVEDHPSYRKGGSWVHIKAGSREWKLLFPWQDSWATCRYP